ncbi:MAG: TIGR00297 family protein [Halodesulfurarchaeum sp.]
MTYPVRRSVAFALLGSISLVGARSIWITAGGYLAIAAGAALLRDGPMFQLLSTPADEREGRLRTAVALSLAAAAIATLVEVLGIPVAVFVATLLTVTYGDLGNRLARTAHDRNFWGTAGFVIVGALAAFLGQLAVGVIQGSVAASMLPEFLFLGTSAAVLGALLRSVLYQRSDPLVLGGIVLLLWLFADLAVAVGWLQIVIAIFVSFGFGYASYALETASIPGMLTGVFLSLLALVLGGYGWFAVLMAFFVVGGLATKYRYEDKMERGIAEANRGARGTENVLGNSLTALAALLLFAAHSRIPLSGQLFVLAYAGSVATALADTLSSEIGGLFDRPRLITSLEPVEPGTDGAVTWQGEIAGLVGASIIAFLSLLLLPAGTIGFVIIVVSGMVGLTADSLAGATLEGDRLGNQGVNLIATAVGGLSGAILAGIVL